MNKIKEIFYERGISQTELGRLLGKSFNPVNLYATNKFSLLFLFYIKLQTF